MYLASVEYLNRQRMNPKLRQWTLRTTVEFGFAVCNWLVSDFYVYLSIVFSTCYHWWICLLVWLLSFFKLLLFNFFILIILYFIYYYFSFLFFSLFFWAMWLTQSWCSSRLSGLHLWCGRAEFRTLDHQRTPGPHVISISDSSPRDIRLNVKTQLHPTASKLQCWMPHAKQLARQEHNPTN